MSEPRIKAFCLWERESRNGNRYFAGYLDGMGIIMFRDEYAEPRDGVIAEWQVFFTEREPREARSHAAALAQPRQPRKVQRHEKPKRQPEQAALDDDISDIGREKEAGAGMRPASSSSAILEKSK